MLAHHFAGEFFIYCSLISYCILNCVKLKTKEFLHNDVVLAWFFPLDHVMKQDKLTNQRQAHKETQASLCDPATSETF
jgi:hypothetical protein